MLKGEVEVEFSEAQLREMVAGYLRIHGGTLFWICRVTEMERVDIQVMAGTAMTKGYRFRVVLGEEEAPGDPRIGEWREVVGPVRARP